MWVCGFLDYSIQRLNEEADTARRYLDICELGDYPKLCVNLRCGVE